MRCGVIHTVCNRRCPPCIALAELCHLTYLRRATTNRRLLRNFGHHCVVVGKRGQWAIIFSCLAGYWIMMRLCRYQGSAYRGMTCPCLILIETLARGSTQAAYGPSL